MKLGDRIRALREDLGISQAELARRAEITKGYMSQIESNQAPRPSGAVLFGLAQALGVTVADLLGKRIEPVDHNVPESLRAFAMQEDLPSQDVEMLAQIKFRGQQPQRAEDWRYIYESIKRTIRE